MRLPVESCECVQLVVRPAPGPVRGRRGTEPSAPRPPGGIHKTAQGYTQTNTQLNTMSCYTWYLRSQTFHAKDAHILGKKMIIVTGYRANSKNM